MFGQTFTTDIILISLLVLGINILIIATKHLHQSLTSDRVDKVQGLHHVPVPRVGCVYLYWHCCWIMVLEGGKWDNRMVLASLCRASFFIRCCRRYAV